MTGRLAAGIELPSGRWVTAACALGDMLKWGAFGASGALAGGGTDIPASGFAVMIIGAGAAKLGLSAPSPPGTFICGMGGFAGGGIDMPTPGFAVSIRFGAAPPGNVPRGRAAGSSNSMTPTVARRSSVAFIASVDSPKRSARSSADFAPSMRDRRKPSSGSSARLLTLTPALIFGIRRTELVMVSGAYR